MCTCSCVLKAGRGGQERFIPRDLSYEGIHAAYTKGHMEARNHHNSLTDVIRISDQIENGICPNGNQ